MATNATAGCTRILVSNGTIEVTNSAWNVAAALIGIAIGVAIGAFISYILYRSFSKSKGSKTIQMEEGSLPLKSFSKKSSSNIEKRPLLDESDIASRKDSNLTSNEESQTAAPSRRKDQDISQSLTAVFTQSTGQQVENELQEQDLRYLTHLESGIHKEKQETFILLFKAVLMTLSEQGHIADNDARHVLTDYEQFISDENEAIAQEKEIKEMEIENTFGAKLTDEKEDQLEEVYKRQNKKTAKIIQNCKIKATDDIKRIAPDLSEDQVNEVMEQITTNMTTVDKRYQEELVRQNQILVDRLSKRKNAIQKINQLEEEELEIVTVPASKHKDILSKLKADKKLTDDNVARIEKNFAEQLENVQRRIAEERDKEQQMLIQKLNKRRKKKMRHLHIQQDEEKTEYDRNIRAVTSGATPIGSFVGEYQDLLALHRKQSQETVLQLDENETREFHDLKQKMNLKLQDLIAEKDSEFFSEVKEMAKLSDKEASKLMKSYEENVNQLRAKLEDERSRQQSKFKEKLKERKKKMAAKEADQKIEQLELAEEQEKAFNQVINSQADLSEETKNQLLLEHKQKVNELTNQLQLTKMRQHKRLEQRLAKRQGKLTDIRKDQAKQRANMGNLSDEERRQLIEQQEAALEEEVSKIEEDEEDGLDWLRGKMQIETEELVKEQDRELGMLLARLQLGQTRRQSIIQRQSDAISRLKDKLVDAIAEERKSPLEAKSTQIIDTMKEHQQTLISQTKEARQRNMSDVHDRVERMKQQREKELQSRLKKEIKGIGVVGKNSPSAVVNHMLLEQRHKQDIKDLEQEMQLELNRQVSKLTKQLDYELKKEIVNNDRSFIIDLAKTGRFTSDEMDDLIESAVADRKSKDLIKREISTTLKKKKSTRRR